MPHFYNLSNNSAGRAAGQRRSQKDFPAAEIHSIAHYLFTESGKEFTESADHKTSEAKDAYRVGLEERLKELQDQLKEAPLEDKDRKELRDVTRRLADLALLSMPARRHEPSTTLTGRLRQAQERIIELYEKQAAEERGRPRRRRSPRRKPTRWRGRKRTSPCWPASWRPRAIPMPVSRRIVDSEGEPVAEPLPEADKNDLAKHTARAAGCSPSAAAWPATSTTPCATKAPTASRRCPARRPTSPPT